MKKLILILATASLAFNGFAGNDDDTKNKRKDPDKYCAEFRDGVLKVIHNGDVLTEDITLANGTKVHTDATIEKKDGSVAVMKDGQCIDLDGNTDDSNFGNKPGETKGMQQSGTEKKKSDVDKNKSGETDYDKGDMNKSDQDKDKIKKSDKNKNDKTRSEKKKDRKSDADDDDDTPLLDRPDHNK